MKTNTKIMSNTILAVVAGFALVGVAAGNLAGQASGSAKGGASALMPATVPVVTKAYQPMSCGTCKDEFVTRRDWTARGASQPNVVAARHGCGGCQTTISSVGQGKAARDVVIHNCTAGGGKSMASCATKGQ